MYCLNADHFYTAPGLAWQAALKMTNVKLELLTDLDMHLFVKKRLRGSINKISKRFANADNSYLSEYDLRKPSEYLMNFGCQQFIRMGLESVATNSSFLLIDHRRKRDDRRSFHTS